MNITKTLLEDILNESLAKDVSDLPNATKKHISGGGTAAVVEGEDSHADAPKLGAGKTATTKRSEKQQERQTANAGSTERIDIGKHDVEMHKHIAALLDAHHAMTSTSNKDDSYTHLSNLTQHLGKIKSAATNFHCNNNGTGKDSIDKDSDDVKGRLAAALKSGMAIARGKKVP